MRTIIIVLLSPVFNVEPGLMTGGEDSAIDAFSAKLTVETLDERVLPRTAGLDVKGAAMPFAQPLQKGVGDGFWTIVAVKGRGTALNGGAGIQDLGCPPEEDSGRREIVQRLMIPVVIVVDDERRECLFQLPREVMMRQVDTTFHGPALALDLAVCLRMVGCATGVLEVVFG